MELKPYHTLILKNINRFVNLTQEEINIFISLLQYKSVKKKDFLLQAGKLAYYEYFIVSGCIKNYTIDEKGGEHITAFAGEDYWTGDLHSFITKKPSKHYLQATEDSQVLQISQDNLEHLYVKVPKFERFFRILYQRSLVNHIERANDNISLSTEEKYLNFKEKYPQIEQRVSQKNMASYLGVTPEFLSVLKKKIKEK